MSPEPAIRRAAIGEAVEISRLALHSKAHWGYEAEFLDACCDELTYSEAQLEACEYEFRVCEAQGSIIGFYALKLLDADVAELEALFVEPGMIGRGYGRLLIDHAKETAAARGVRQIIIQGDPNAESFYIATGGVRDGERESGSIPERFLPIFRIGL